MKKDKVLEIIHLKTVIKEQADFIQLQREKILDLNKIIDILFKGIKSIIFDKKFSVDKLRKEVWQCVEEKDVHSVDSVDADTKEGGQNA